MTLTATLARAAHLQVRTNNERLWRETLRRPMGPTLEEAARIIPMLEEKIHSTSQMIRAVQEASVDRLPQVQAFAGPFYQHRNGREGYWPSGHHPLSEGTLEISRYFGAAGYRVLLQVCERGTLPYAFVRANDTNDTNEVVYHPDGGDIKVQSVDLIVTWSDDTAGTTVEQWQEALAQRRKKPTESGETIASSQLLM